MFHRSASVGFLEQIAQDGVDAFVVVFLQLVEAAESGVGCGQGISFLPATGGELVEVVCRSNGFVEVDGLDSRLSLGHSHDWGGCHSDGHHEMFHKFVSFFIDVEYLL